MGRDDKVLRVGMELTANKTIKELQEEIHATAVEKGFWRKGDDRNKAEVVMLVVTELAEVVEGLRHGNPPSEKIPQFSAIEEEFADAIIRILDAAHMWGLDIEGAIEAKNEFNRHREYMHGGKEF